MKYHIFRKNIVSLLFVIHLYLISYIMQNHSSESNNNRHDILQFVLKYI